MVEKYAREYLKELYLDYFNHYLTVERIAEHNEIDVLIMQEMLSAGKKYHNDDAELLVVDRYSWETEE